MALLRPAVFASSKAWSARSMASSTRIAGSSKASPNDADTGQRDASVTCGQRASSEFLADALDHRLANGEIGPRQRDQELIATVAVHLVVWTEMLVEVPHHALQDLVAHLVAVLIVDLLEVVEVHEDDAALLDSPLRELAPLAQVRQHLGPPAGAGQRIEVPQRTLDLVPQRIDGRAQSRTALDQFLVPLTNDGRAGRDLLQQPCRDPVQVLVLRPDRRERRLPPQIGGRSLVIPSTELAMQVRVVSEVDLLPGGSPQTIDRSRFSCHSA